MQKQHTEVCEITFYLCQELWLPAHRASPGTQQCGSAMGGRPSAGLSPPCLGEHLRGDLIPLLLPHMSWTCEPPQSYHHLSLPQYWDLAGIPIPNTSPALLSQLGIGG